MSEVSYCPRCCKNGHEYPWALIVNGVDLKKKFWRRNTYEIIESHKPCPGCGIILKTHATVEISQ